MPKPTVNHAWPRILEIGSLDLPVTFEGWVGSRRLSGLGTNSGADVLAFQGWRHFKEAFPPELVARAIRESDQIVSRCLDPFGGSGTTALACQFLGVRPITIEVNPYLADLIEAKLTNYDTESLARDAGRVVEHARDAKVDVEQQLSAGPATLVEPGQKERWVFDKEIAHNILAILKGIEALTVERNKRLFKVILGGQLVNLSNVRISGKGRRYRSGWQSRSPSPESVYNSFVDSLSTAIHDISLYRHRACKSYELRRGDARNLISDVEPVDLVVFSPPYPNSFDYTDVYNLELWMLGYLQSRSDNTKLRHSTLTSHVQLQRQYASAPSCSAELAEVIGRLNEKRSELWHRDIPAMIGGYFFDLLEILKGLRNKLSPHGRVYMVVGDSQYAGVLIPVGSILSEIANSLGYDVMEVSATRSMRSSAQQGGDSVLPETLLVLRQSSS